MNLTVSTPNNITSPPGNSLAVYIDATTGLTMLKDINGQILPFNYVPGNNVYVTPEQFGAVGDGITDDSGAIQAAIDSRYPLCIPEKTYLVTNITISNPGLIFGFGSESVLKTTSDDTMFTLNTSMFGFTFVKLQGSGTAQNYTSDNPNQKGIKIEGFYFHNVFTNVVYENLDGAGFYGKDNSDGVSTTVMNGVMHNNCQFISCLYGCLVDELFEYNLFTGCNWETNQTGIEIKAGNNSIIGGSIISNQLGLKLSTGPNDGHSVISGTTINHNVDYGIDADSIANGYLFSNCVIFFNAIRLVSCANMVFDGGLFKTTPYTITNCTSTVIANIKYESTPTYTITGESPRFFNNSYPSATPATAKESITALTNYDIFDIIGTTAAKMLLRLKENSTNRMLLGSDAGITGGAAANMNWYVYGNNHAYISVNGVKIFDATPTGVTIAGILTSQQLRLSELNTAPASASATGTLGEIRITADYIYVCIATNTWVRSPLTTW